MKNSFIVLSIAFMLFMAVPVMAATSLSLSPNNVSVEPGDTFIITVSANASEKIGAGQIDLDFSQDVVKVTGFNWVDPTSFDVSDNKQDNATGELTQVGGFQGGDDGSLILANITFEAISQGSGSITLTSDTDWYNQNGDDTVSSLPNSVSVEVSTPESVMVEEEPETVEPDVVVEEEATPVLTDTSETQEEVVSETSTTTIAGEASDEEDNQAELLAQASESNTSSYVWLVIVLVVVAAGYIVYSRKRGDK